MPEFYNQWQRTLLRRVSNVTECDADQEAIEKAQQAVNGFGQEARRIAQLKPAGSIATASMEWLWPNIAEWGEDRDSRAKMSGCSWVRWA
jgi:hypothetical protein